MMDSRIKRRTGGNWDRQEDRGDHREGRRKGVQEERKEYRLTE